MIVTIDGPAGAGKSTVARALAARLGFEFLDTGAMYRAVALAGLRRGVDWERPEELARLAAGLRIEVRDGRTWLNGEDVTQAVRAEPVTAVTRHAADNTEGRRRLVELQRQVAADRDVVTEGRDQGTVAFPEAECKFFLTASPEERARRRVRDLEKQGEAVGVAEVLAAQQCRDREDENRPVGALRRAENAIDIPTDGLSADEVVERMARLVNARRTGPS